MEGAGGVIRLYINSANGVDYKKPKAYLSNGLNMNVSKVPKISTVLPPAESVYKGTVHPRNLMYSGMQCQLCP